MAEPNFGAELRRRRLAAGLSLAGLSALTFYSKGHLSKIENGLVVPRPANAWALDSALGAGGGLVAQLPGRTTGGGEARTGALSGLPRDSAHLYGRQAELREIVSVLCGATTTPGRSVICALDGMAGVGKTALAVRVAHQVADRFPDGRIFLDLHGHTGTIPPLSATEALDRLLRRLGVAADRIPGPLDERAALYRELTACRDLLVVLDNVLNAAQIRPLLPTGSGTRLLVTGRHLLRSVDEAHRVRLGALPDSAARAVFRSVAGGVAEAELATIVAACGGLPLALRIAAARCRGAPPAAVARFGRLLAAGERRLAELTDGERDVMAAFEVSVRALPERPRGLLLRLGLHPGADWTAPAAAALTGADLAGAERDLERLFDANLVLRYTADRYRFHDLMREHVQRIAAVELAPRDRAEAVERLLIWSLDMVVRADTVITPHRYRPPGQPPGSPASFELGTYEEALAWLTAEHDNLIQLCRDARDRGRDAYVWRLAYALRGYFFLTKRWDDWIATHRLAVGCAVRAGDRRAEAMTRNDLGLALMERGDLDEAYECFREALRLFRSLSDQDGETNAIANRAAVGYLRGDYERSLADNLAAHEYYRRHSRDRNAAITLRSIALVELELAQFPAALDHLESALKVFENLGLELDRIMATNCVAEVHLRAGHPRLAEPWAMEAARLAVAYGSPYEEARAHTVLAATATSERAAAWYRARAVSGFDRLGAPEARDLWLSDG